jgi:branched-chain amino acid transport system permease protein
MTRADVRYYGLCALGLAAFPFVLHLVHGYAGLATQILIVGIAAIGFNLLLGYAGLLSYGQAMFYGVGSYVALLTVSRFFPNHPNFWLALVLAVAFVSLMALVVGALTVRLYGIYFALLTLAFAQMFFFIVFEWRDLTHGDDGLQGITAPPLALGFTSLDLTSQLPHLALGPFGDLSDIRWWYIFAAVVVLLVLIFVRTLVASQFGEVLGAIRENEERSTFVGFDPARYKLAAFVIAGALTGLAGALKGLYETSTAVDTLDIDTSGSFVIYTVVGGVQTLLGPLAGTALVMYLQNVISAVTDAWRLIEGLVFVAIVIFLPGGILGAFRARKPARAKLAAALRTRPGGGSEGA